MERRHFLRTASAGVAAVGTLPLAAPAIAADAPTIVWRLTSSFPKSLDTIYGGAETLARRVAQATDGRFRIEVFAAGEPVPGLKAAAAVASGAMEMAHTCAYYSIGEDPAFCWASGVPFGLNARQLNAWFYHGGGNELLDAFWQSRGFVGLPGGNTGTQMGGWFRKEIRSIADLNGLRMRIGGIAGRVMAKLGVVPQQLAGGDIRGALEAARIDAAEWVGPHDDEALGLHKGAPYYCYPGFCEGGTAMHFFIDRAKWEALPASYRAVVTAAAAEVNLDVQAKYDARNPAALKRLVQAGAQLRPFPVEVIDAAHKAANELYAELGRDNPWFKRLHEAVFAFRNDEYLWWQVAEFGYDAYMIRSRTRG